MVWHGASASQFLVQPPPLFTPLEIRQTILPNRVIVGSYITLYGRFGANLMTPHRNQLLRAAQTGAALLLTEPVAVAANGRITSGDTGLYDPTHVVAWREILEAIHSSSTVQMGFVLNHAGRRGATQPRQRGMDRPLRQDSWELLAPISSALFGY